MKFNGMLRIALAAGMSLAIGLGATACSRDYTAAYVYSASNSNGTISGFAVDYETGILTQLSGSPFTTQFTNPMTIVASPDNKYVYLIGGSQNAAVEEFAVGTDGKLYAQNTYNITGTYPTAAAVDPTGSYLYVTYTYQNGYSHSSPGPGGVTIFPITADTSSSGAGSLGTPINVNVGNNPVGVAISVGTCTATPATGTGQTACSGGHENVFAYVLDDEGSTASPSAEPTILGFAENTSTGALTLLSGSAYSSTLGTYQGYQVGVTPSAIVVDPTGRFVYVTDKTSNEIYGAVIDTTATGNLTAQVDSPYTTGLYPVSIVIDPRGKYVYTANYNGPTVSAFVLNSATGQLGAASAGNFTPTAGPTCVTIEPALGIYLYTSDYLNASLSGAKLSAETGGLTEIANSPFTTGSLPNCLVAVANGAHAVQQVYPN